jgi:hypothetical protein
MIPSSLIPRLASAADTALRPVLKTGAVAHGQTTPTGEVGFVAAAVLGGVPAIAGAWRPILGPAGYKLRVNGVFCHQTPQATFSDTSGVSRTCELADLLVVIDDLTGGSQNRRWATLIQAKMAASSGGKTITQAMDLRQLDLYTRWPSFTLPAGYHPAPRDFSTCSYAGLAFDCGRYGLIDGQPNPLWHQQSPALAMPAGGLELGAFLAHMVEAGQTGFGREATGTSDDWSRTVEELMTVAYANVFNYAAGFSGPRSRGHTAIAFSVSDLEQSPEHVFQIIFGGEPPPSGGRPEQPDDFAPDGGAVSVLRIGIAREGEWRG